MNKEVHNRLNRFNKRNGAAWLPVLLAGALALTACSPAADEAPADDAATAETAAQIAPPAVKEEGQLSVCSALGLGAIPLFYFDENQEPSGLEIEIAQEFAERLGLEYVAEATAFPSLVPSLLANQCDLVMGSLFITPEREEQIDFVPYLTSGTILVVKADNPHGVTGMDSSICGLRVAAPTGSSGVPAAQQQSQECEENGEAPITLTEIDSAATGTQMVVNEQADAFAGTSADMFYAAQQSDGAFEIAGEPFEEVVIGAGVRKDNPELKEAIAAVFDEMREDGTYESILAELGLERIAYEG